MRVIWVGIALFLTTVNASVAAFGPITFSSDADYNNNNPPTSGLFRDIGPLVRQQGINRGFDLGPTGHTALNFVGTAGAGGSMLSDAGNTDNNILSIADMNGPAMTTLQSTSLSGGLGEVAWYRLTMDMTVSGGTFIINGKVFSHTTGTDPGSALGSQIGSTLAYTNTFAALGIQSSGEIGLAMREILQAAPNTNMVSITNFSEVPEPTSTSLVVMGLTLCSVAGLGMFVRRRKSA